MGEVESARGPFRGSPIPLLGVRILWETLVDRSRDGMGCGRGLWRVDLDNNGASAAPINFAHESFPVLLVGFHPFILADSDQVLRCTALWDPLGETHATAFSEYEIAGRTL